ncbi:hypothetical protein RDV89_18655 [Nocardioides zeae]|uniref:Uncharacterized protein n=1 Tax=Nocardioides imazamoxiresistens TaxID=3231893 RepID=A0ABU3Q0T3_9ACTN|nr:hypothetical protein [Nocardioides zeae]MDT9595115.1 hypothetical protein [Nocardioides zeae]
MTTALQLAIGVALVAAGAVLALGFPDAELGWFEGRPLGIVLVVVGVIDLVEGLWRRGRAA